MNNEVAVREWFGAVRAAADKAIGELADPPGPNTLRRVKTDMLLRQYLRDGLELRVAQGEGVGRKEAAGICREIYSELMEDAMAGIWSPNEDGEIIRFLDMCTVGVSKPGMFAELLRRALDSDVTDDLASSLMHTADQELECFAMQRKTA